jgi:hypothetical protein
MELFMSSGAAAVLSPLRGSLSFYRPPTACAVGCLLTPLRGWFFDRVKVCFGGGR